MDKYKWRKKTKFVGYVDLVFALIGLLLLTFNAIAISTSTTEEDTVVAHHIPPPPPLPEQENRTGRQQQGTEQKTEIVGSKHAQEIWTMYYGKTGTTVVLIMLVATAVGAVITILQTLAAINLLKSTKKSREPRQSLKLGVFWKNTNVCFILLFGICFGGVITEWLPVKLFGTVFIGFLLRVIFMYIVMQFMKELEMACGDEPLVLDDKDDDEKTGDEEAAGEDDPKDQFEIYKKTTEHPI